jgi:hypothetical protein
VFLFGIAEQKRAQRLRTGGSAVVAADVCRHRASQAGAGNFQHAPYVYCGSIILFIRRRVKTWFFAIMSLNVIIGAWYKYYGNT